MADDIDIEEHDILENPRIKDILPHLNIKEEPLDITAEEYEETFAEYDDNEMGQYEEDEMQDNSFRISFSESPLHFNDEPKSPPTDSSNEIYYYKNKIILGSKPCPKAQLPIILGTKTCPSTQDPIITKSKEPSTSQDPIIFATKSQRPIFSRPCPKSRKQPAETPILRELLVSDTLGRILLGTKSPRPERVLEDAVVMVEDWSERLNNSPCYCRECETLFATQNALDAHNMTAHSFLVAMDKPECVDIKPSITNSPEVAELPKDSAKYCNQCQTYFEDGNLLIQHLYDHLTARRSEPEKQFYKCPICFAFYVGKKRFINHTLMNHFARFDSQRKESFSFKCAHCNKPATLGSLNKHIQKVHNSIYEKKFKNDELEIFKKKHRSTKAIPKSADNIIEVLNKKQSAFAPKTLRKKVAKFKCKKCSTFYATEKTISTHIRLKHPNEKNTIVDLAKKQNRKNQYVFYKTLVAENVIFKCKKCNVHLLCATSFKLHITYKCVNNNKWNCKTCNKTFKYPDRKDHEQQHLRSNNIKTYTFSKDIYHRVLCKCWDCNVYFEERLFLKHRNQGCLKDSGKRCSICKIKVNNLRFHNSLHLKKLTKSDFIFIDKFFAPSRKSSKTEAVSPKKSLDVPKTAKVLEESSAKAVSLKRKLPPIERKSKKAKSTAKVTIYYCNVCCTYGKHAKYKEYHLSNHCLPLKERGIVCPYCGLMFRQGPSINKHKEDHIKNKRTLKDFVFINIQTDETFIPPLPNFKTCPHCKVQHVFKHKCNDPRRTCNTCNASFNRIAFKLHLMHHKYLQSEVDDVSVLIEKYDSLTCTWNVIYLCTACNLATDSYDKAIEHSQRHITSSSYQESGKKCEICSINLEATSVDKHTEIHSNNQIDKTSFNIMEYNCNDLLTDDWFKMFGNLSKKDIEQLTSSSIYGTHGTRALKMTMILNGPHEFTIYKCENCRNYVEVSRVYDHTLRCDGSSSSSTCDVCGIPFSSIDCLESHKKIHKNAKITANSYRIVSFNSKSDKVFNTKLSEVQSQVPMPSSTKEESKLANILSTQDSSNTIKYFQCQSCKSCSIYSNYVYKHHCIESDKAWRCNMCPFVTNHKSSHYHLKWHTLLDIKTKEIVFVPFGKRSFVDIKPDVAKSSYFKCKQCELLVVFGSKHICDKSYARRCSTCMYDFSPKAFDLHMRDHREDESLTREGVTVVSDQSPVEHKIKEEVSTSDTEREMAVFKCFCGLHFPSKSTFKKHSVVCSSELEVSSENCSKCNLLFPTDLLVSHSCNHHSSENKTKIKIVTVVYRCDLSNCLFPTKSKFYGHHIQRLCKFTEGVKCENCDLVLHPDMMDSHISAQCGNSDLYKILTLTKPKLSMYTLYKCGKCSVHLLNKFEFSKHTRRCKGELLSELCNICSLTFPAALLHKHEQLHHNTFNFKVEDFRILNEKDLKPQESDDSDSGTEKSVPLPCNVTGYKHTLHQCWCGLCFLTHGSLYDHVQTVTNHYATKRLDCTKCGYSFSAISLRKHNEIHHRMMRLKAKDFEIKKDQGNYALIHKQINEKVEARVTNSLYQCSVCELSFIKFGIGRRHFISKCNDSTQKETCNICGLVFETCYMSKHKTAHNKFKYKLEDFHIFVFVQDSIKDESAVDDDVGMDINLNDNEEKDVKFDENRSEKVTLYKCGVCNVHYWELSPFNRHLAGSHSEEKTECSICGLGFTTEVLADHKLLHHDQMKLEIKDVTITSNEDAEPESVGTSETQPAEQEDEEIPNAAEWTKKAKHLADVLLYRCSKCDLHFFGYSTGASHVDNDHKSPSIMTCSECGLRFTLAALRKHTVLHHRKRNFTAKDFVIHDIDKMAAEKNTLYKCSTCNINFMCLASLDAHIKKKIHNIFSAPCPQCGLLFSPSTLTKHLTVHHIKRDAQLEKLKIKSLHNPLDDSSVNLDSSAANEIVQVSSLTSMEVEDVVMQRSLTLDDAVASQSDDNNSQEWMDMTNARIDDSMSEKSDVVDKNDTDNLDESAVSQSSDSELNAKVEKEKSQIIKLYKCGGCNVFFMNQATCYKHVLNHSPMDTKEYIECKLCSLQFRIVSLSRHIQKHHVTDFELSKVLVEEYQPKMKTEKTPKIDIYYAIDKVQSRLVSTTTDDDKMESDKISQNVTQSDINNPTVNITGKNTELVDDKCLLEKNDGDCLSEQKDTIDQTILECKDSNINTEITDLPDETDRNSTINVLKEASNITSNKNVDRSKDLDSLREDVVNIPPLMETEDEKSNINNEESVASNKTGNLSEDTNIPNEFTYEV